jgi:hypothetical protein
MQDRPSFVRRPAGVREQRSREAAAQELTLRARPGEGDLRIEEVRLPNLIGCEAADADPQRPAF